MFGIPHIPRPEHALERSVAHTRPQGGIHRVAERAVASGEHGDVAAAGQRDGLNHEATDSTQRALGQHVVEQHGIDASTHKIGVRMHIVVVGHGQHAVRAFRVEQHVPRHRGAEGSHPATAQVGQAVDAPAVGCAHREHLAELVIRQRHREARMQCRSIFEARHAHREVAAGYGLFDRCPRDLYELRFTTESPRDHAGDLDIEAAHLAGVGRIGFHEGSTPFGIAAPAESLRGRRRGGGR